RFGTRVRVIEALETVFLRSHRGSGRSNLSRVEFKTLWEYKIRFFFISSSFSFHFFLSPPKTRI
ncbi:hypothetical protein LINPERHAP1_LOCUS15849, partial [Linum perenne]